MSQQEKSGFADRLVSYRKREGISQETLAKRLGISRNYVSMIESGREPSDQIVRHFTLLELSPAAAALKRRAAAEPDRQAKEHSILRRVLFIEEHGSREQVQMLDALLETFCEQVSTESPSTTGEAPGRAESEHDKGKK
jgi:transcriptional regulator with XRE-family HTH domain